MFVVLGRTAPFTIYKIVRSIQMMERFGKLLYRIPVLHFRLHSHKTEPIILVDGRTFFHSHNSGAIGLVLERSIRRVISSSIMVCMLLRKTFILLALLSLVMLLTGPFLLILLLS